MSCVDLYCKKCRSSMHVSCNLSGKSDQELLTGAVMKCYRCKRVITMHIPRNPGEQIEVDWAGDPAHIIDPDTGEIIDANYDTTLNIYTDVTEMRKERAMEELAEKLKNK